MTPVISPQLLPRKVRTHAYISGAQKPVRTNSAYFYYSR
jgi:hypothetical protein